MAECLPQHPDREQDSHGPTQRRIKSLVGARAMGADWKEFILKVTQKS